MDSYGGRAKAEKSGLRNDKDALLQAAQGVRGLLVAPGQMKKDDANAYFARISNLFSGVDRLTLDLALFGWAALHGTGADTNYAEAEPIEAGGVSHPATAVFGGIIPVDSRGYPRKAFSTYFEVNAVRYLEVLPELSTMLTSRAAKSGFPGAPPLMLIDFVKGVTASTIGDAGIRVSMKDNLLARRGKGTKVSSASGVSTPTPVVELGGHSNGGGGLY